MQLIQKAVKRVYDIKKRADSKAMLVLVDSTVKVNFMLVMYLR